MAVTLRSSSLKKFISAIIFAGSPAAFLRQRNPSLRILPARNPRVVASAKTAGPKLVVVLVVDQMRGDYVDKFQHQWTGGLKRLVNEGAWFHDAAYPYASTETCVGHSTISTGSFPATHGMVTNEWWDREKQARRHLHLRRQCEKHRLRFRFASGRVYHGSRLASRCRSRSGRQRRENCSFPRSPTN